MFLCVSPYCYFYITTLQIRLKFRLCDVVLLENRHQWLDFVYADVFNLERLVTLWQASLVCNSGRHQRWFKWAIVNGVNTYAVNYFVVLKSPSEMNTFIGTVRWWPIRFRFQVYFSPQLRHVNKWWTGLLVLPIHLWVQGRTMAEEVQCGELQLLLSSCFQSQLTVDWGGEIWYLT